MADDEIADGALVDGVGAPRFPILFSLAAEFISDEVAERIRAYVSAGGHAYVGGASWTRDTSGEPRLDDGGRPMAALAAERGLGGWGWAPLTHVDKASIDRMVDHLPDGEHEWQMPRRYDWLDISARGWAVSEWHRIWATEPSTTAPATVLLRGRATGAFHSSTTNPPRLPSGATAVTFGDVDGDGFVDLAFRVGSFVYVRLSTGQEFLPHAEWTFWSEDYDFTRLADVDGDRRADIVGRLRDGTDVQVGLSDGSSFQPSTAWTWWSTAYDHRFADVDGDGKADIVGRSGAAGDVQVGLSTGGSFARSSRWAPYDSGTAVQLADVDRNGRADLVFRVGDSIHVRRSRRSAGIDSFGADETWSFWSTNYDLHVADVTGDGAADAVGRNSDGDVQVGPAAVGRFAPSSSWSTWSNAVTMSLVNFSGDGRMDLVGYDIGVPEPEVHAGLSGGMGVPGPIKLAIKSYGAGQFTYNAAPLPLAGYGGAANDNSEYKTIRVAVERAFAAAGRPLVTLSAWPFPYRAGFIYRHDHFLARDVHQLEVELAGASTTKKFGEYYIWPDDRMVGTCGLRNDFPDGIDEVVASGGLIGAHVMGHRELDRFDETEAVSWLEQTKTNIRSMSPIFVAPVYRAVRSSSIRAIWSTGFLTTGEQGVGPFPHVSIDPEVDGGRIGTLLQLPTSEWPGFDNIERMSELDANDSETSVLTDAAKLSFDLGGLINVYDHVGSDAYLAGCPTNIANIRVHMAQRLLRYVASLPNVWYANSLTIRDWYLQRTRREITVATGPAGAGQEIDVTVAATSPAATTPHPEDAVALRVTLTGQALSLRDESVTVSVDGVPGLGVRCDDQQDLLRCRGNELLVKIGAARRVIIHLGL